MESRAEQEPVRPEPLPVPPPAPVLSRRSRVLLTAAVALVFISALAACVYLGAVLTGRAALSWDPFLAFEPPGLFYRDVWWAGGGEYGVVQGADGGGRPYVLVWERSTGRVRRLEGRRVVAVEPHAPEVWLTPDDGAERGRWADEGFRGGIDVVPAVLTRWALASPRGPSRVDSDVVEWSAWRGPGGVTARLMVDRRRGAMPSWMEFVSAEGTVVARTPLTEVTYAPIGWSPSGRYFAAYQMMRRASPEEEKELTEDDPEAGEGPAYVGDNGRVIFDATTGNVVAVERTDGTSFEGSPPYAAWDVRRDVLYYPYVVSEPGGEDGAADDMVMGIAALEPTGRQSDAFALNRWPRPDAFEKTDQVLLLGSGPKGAVFVTDIPDEQTWRLGPSGPERLDFVPETGMPAAWSANGDVLSYDAKDGPIVRRADGTVLTIADETGRQAE